MHVILFTAATLLVLGTTPSTAWDIIAHRGIFHDVNSDSSVPENSAFAFAQANTFDGIRGVEIDVKVTVDGQAVAFHDDALNALTFDDGDGGRLNPLDVATGVTRPPLAKGTAAQTLNYLSKVGLKVFYKSKIVNDDNRLLYPVASLREVLALLTGKGAVPLSIVLDAKKDDAADAAASLVHEMGLQERVQIKFWAALAIDSRGYQYNGADTCYRYARDHGWAGLKVIPEINEIQLNKKGNINVFGTELTIGAYLDCWHQASKAHGSQAASMSTVSAMVPNSVNERIAEASANAAFDWAEANGCVKMSVIVMPDLCSLSRGSGGGPYGRKPWRIAGGISAAYQDKDEVTRRISFCDQRADACIVDLMTDRTSFTVTYDYNKYMDGICPENE